MDIETNESTLISGATEHTPLLFRRITNCDEQTQTTKSRFWILLLFSLFSCVSCWQWNTWGPISESVVAAYPDWGSSRVALMANLGTIILVVCMWPVCWVVERLGMRTSMLITCCITTLALALRCLTKDPYLFTVMSTVSACVLGVAMTMVMAVPPLIAMDWFPPAERATAQAVMFAMEQLGLMVSYLEPLLVRLPGPSVTVHDLRQDITRLMYIGTGCSAVLSMACLLYFPSRPSAPPSAVAAADRTSLWQGVGCFCRRRQLWLVMLCYFLCTGPAFGWLTVLNYSLLPLGVHQNEAMYIGGAAIVVSAVSATVAGRYSDHSPRRLRLTLVLMLMLCSGAFYWFLLLSAGTIPFSKWQVYASVILGISLNFACIPAFYEMVQEMAFPCPEVVVGGMLATADNVSAALFLLAYQIPNIGFGWVPVVLVLSCGVVVVPLFHLSVNYVRLQIDERC